MVKIFLSFLHPLTDPIFLSGGICFYSFLCPSRDSVCLRLLGLEIIHTFTDSCVMCTYNFPDKLSCILYLIFTPNNMILKLPHSFWLFYSIPFYRCVIIHSFSLIHFKLFLVFWHYKQLHSRHLCTYIIHACMNVFIG